MASPLRLVCGLWVFFGLVGCSPMSGEPGPPGSDGGAAGCVEDAPCGDCDGVRACVDGVLGPCIGPEEVCDGRDQDCDGRADEGVDGAACLTGSPGPCAEGVMLCADGAGRCVPEVAPTDEVCNDVDDDCDGLIDEGADGRILTAPCYEGPPGTEGVGVCTGGMRICGDGRFGRCVEQVVPRDERCDGRDDDCDGAVDELPPEACACTPGEVRGCYDGPPGTEGVGICAPGTQVCAADGQSFGPCEQLTGPSEETCDGLDEDCDGVVDEVAGLGAPCAVGVGPCRVEGVTVCGPGGPVCGAAPGAPAPEVCGNGLDEDCSGVADDALECGIACAADGDCPAGAGCADGLCVRVECRADRDCPAGQRCVDLQCGVFECRDDGDCAEGACVDRFCAPARQACVDPPRLEGFGRVFGTTVGAPDEIGAACADGAAQPEAVWRLALPYSGSVCLNTDGSLYDTALYVQRVCGAEGSELACDDDGGENQRSQIELDVVQGEALFVVVDGFGEGEGGRYALEVAEGPCPCRDDAGCGAGEACRHGACAPVVCGDGIVEGPERCDDGDAAGGDGCSADCHFERDWVCALSSAECDGERAVLRSRWSGAPVALPTLGGEEGAPFDEACPGGQLLVGLDLALGERWGGAGAGIFVQQARGRCAALRVDAGRPVLEPAPPTATRGSVGDGVFDDALLCPPGMVLTGYEAYAAAAGGEVALSGLAGICRPLVGLPARVGTGDRVITPVVGRAAQAAGLIECAADQVLHGFTGRSGQVVHGVGGRCEGLELVCAGPTTCRFDGVCLDDAICPAGRLCIDGACVEAECADGAGCPAGTVCYGLQCVPGDCRENADCAPDAYCAQFQCTPRPPEGTLRLWDPVVFGQEDDPVDGRLEVFFDGRWGRVCGDNWGPEDVGVREANADVACRQLGYPRALRIGADFPDDGRPIWLRDVRCAGDEQALAECPAAPVGSGGCPADEVVYLVCQGPGMCLDHADCPPDQRCAGVYCR